MFSTVYNAQKWAKIDFLDWVFATMEVISLKLRSKTICIRVTVTKAFKQNN